MNNRYLPEGELIREYENREYLSSGHALERACERRKILESFALLCDSNFNLHFDLGGIPGIMPRDEVVWSQSGDPVKDIAAMMHTREDRLSVRLFRLREKLRKSLQKEGLLV